MIDIDRFISASAGTGKTHTISKTYVDLFEQAIQTNELLDVGNVVAITFTRKAAAELKSRILDMIKARDDGNPAWQQLRSSMTVSWISTIDAFAHRILSEIGIFAEVNPDLQIGSGSAMGDILKRCIARIYFEHEDLLKPLLEFYTLDGITDALFNAVLEKRHAMISSRPANQMEAGLAMESALEFRNEYQIIKPFDTYILYGRLDKVINTPEGWKILDFKFSRSESYSNAHEFQMRFYLYRAREIFSPMLSAELFYLKDGVSIKVQLDNEAVRDFENDLLSRIESYQKAI